ncbi:MAG TPA: hypothetical protein VGJ85_06370, partial [Candidatus Nanopelagicaceae bacterium]
IESGRPLMAGLFFDYPKDSEIWDAKYEYMLGRYLLVCPVTEPDAKSSRVYLPEGDWIDFWSKESIPGQQWIEVETPVSRIPVFIRSDAPLWVTSLREK